MKTYLCQIMSIVAAAFVYGVAHAQPDPEIVVEVWCGVNVTRTYYDPGDPISIDVTQYSQNGQPCPDQINIWDHDGPPIHDIGPVYLYGDRTDPIKVTMSSGAFRENDSTQHIQAGKDWGGLTAEQNLVPLVWIDGHVTGNLTGLIYVGQVHGLYIDGTVEEPIQANASSSGLFWLQTGGGWPECWLAEGCF